MKHKKNEVSDKMSVQSKNLRKYIIPAMISNAAFFVLTIVDGIFVGNGVGTDALGAVNLGMPFVMVVGAFSALLTIGGVAVAAVRFGRGDDSGANQAFMHSVLAIIIVFAAFTVAGMLFAKQLAVLLGANETFVKMVSDYIFWYSLFSIPAGLHTCLSSFCRNDGNPKISTMAALISTTANIFLDWLFVFPLQKGVAGAAIATGLSQVLAVITLLTHYLGKKGKLRFYKFKVKFSLYKKIIPELVSQFAAPITTYSMNRMLIGISDAHVNAFSVIGYASSLFAALMYGLSAGMQPLFGQSYGAKDEKSLKYYLKSGLMLGVIGGIAVLALTFFIGKPLCALFGADVSAVDIVVTALPKYSLNFVFATASAVIASYLFSTKRTQYAIPLNICRSIVFNFLCINFLPLIFGADFVWYTIDVAEAICLVIALALWRASERKGIIYK